MEMENSALQHTMAIQTQLMQQIVSMQQQQDSDRLSEKAQPIQPIDSPSLNTNQPVNMTSAPVPNGTPPTQQMMAPSAPVNNRPTNSPMQSTVPLVDPSQYGAYASSPYPSGGRQQEAVSPFTQAKGFVASSIQEMRDFDATRHSKESTAAFISDQARGVQEQAVNVAGGALQGATAAASLFIPGIVPSLVVGGAASLGVKGLSDAFVGETKEALNYQDILQDTSYKFLNAFESTDEMGGIGMGLEDRQDVSRFLRHLAPEKFLDEGEMSQILEGSANNNLLKTVNDVKSFKKKFTEVVDAVKEITVTMNQSIEEATKFMGDMEARGISTKDMPLIAAQTKVMSSMLGIDATQGQQIVMQTSDQITQGTAMDATNTIRDTAKSAFVAQTVQDQAKEDGDSTYNYIKNNGGASQMGPTFEATARQYITSEQNQDYLLGLYAPAFELNDKTGEFELNKTTFKALTDGDLSYDDMQKASRNYMNTLSNADRLKLLQTAGSTLNESTNTEEVAALVKRNTEVMQEATAKSGNKIDFEQAMEEAGIAQSPEQAKFFKAMIDTTLNEDLTSAYEAKVLKEEQDSHAISNSPGVLKRAGFWWEDNVTSNIGDKSQDMSDSIGKGMQEYQKFLTGVDDRSMVGGSLETFDDEGLDSTIDSTAKGLNEYAESMKEYDSERSSQLMKEGKDFESVSKKAKSVTRNAKPVDAEDLKKKIKGSNVEELDTGRYRLALSRVKEGKLDASEVAEISRKSDEGDYSFNEYLRAGVIERKAKGEYDGFWGTMDYGMDRAIVGVSSGAEATGKWIGEKVFNVESGDEVRAEQISYEDFRKQGQEMQESKKGYKQQLTQLLTSGDKEIKKLSDKELDALEEAIKDGDTKKVKKLTKNEDALTLAKSYKTVEAQEEKYAVGMKEFEELTRQTKAVATSPTQLSDLLAASDVYSENEIDKLLGGVRKRGKKTTKQIKKGKLSAVDMVESIDATQDEMEEVFDNMTDYDMQKFAKYLDKRDSSVTYKDFLTDGEMDSDKLEKYVMSTLQKQHVSNPEGKDSKKDSNKEAKDAAKEHQEAMSEFVAAFQNETQMMKEAMDGTNVTQKKSTSLTNR